MTRPGLGRRLVLAVLAVFVVALASTGMATAQGWTHPMLAHGQQPNHGYFSAAPWERVDMASGNVILTFPGLTLPGANGMDFQFTAVANTGGESGAVVWSYGVSGPATIAFGYGYSNNPVVGTTDGGRQVAYTAGPYRYRTQSWDLLEIDIALDDATLKRPDGVVHSFQRYNSSGCAPEGEPSTCVYRITHTVDSYGNGLDYVRTTDGTLTGFVQHVGGQTRTITLTHETDALVVNWAGEGVPARTWRYVFEPNTMHLAEIVPPTGPGWGFDYTTPHAVTVTTPNGGHVTYQMQLQYGPNQEYAPHQPIYHTWRLQSRTVEGVEDPWTFAFEDVGSPAINSSVTLPTGDVRSYQHTRIEGGVYAARQVLATVAVNPGASCAEVITYTWRTSLYAVGTPVGVCPDLSDETTRYQEDAAPMLIGAVTTAREGASFTTTYAYCGESGQPPCSNVGDPLSTSNVLDYGNPTFVRETSTVTAAEWVTRYTYRDDFGARYLRGRVATQTLESGSASYSRSAQYDDTGFRVSETVLDTPTTFARDGAGQVQSVTDFNGHTTSSSYEWGVVENTQTPEFLITRTIKSDGHAWSVTQNGATTAYEYDALGRQTRMHPPVGNDTWTTYAEDGTGVTVARGASWTRTALDGLGRAVGTQNSQGVHTATEYDELGRTKRVRAPYDGAHPEEQWTSFTYDALDRVKERTNPDHSTVNPSKVTYNYTTVSTGVFTGLQTTITDENSHITQQLWQAVGAPEQAWLRAVTDAANQTTWYEYNALGSLTKVTSPGGVLRTWIYNGKNQLASQTQPESGTVTYGYDNVGNLITQTDAKSQTTSYIYDGNDRLTHVTSPDAMYSTTMTYDAANNRRTLANGYVSTTFDYDEANRLTRRTDALNSRSFVSAYTFDANGAVVDVQYPSGNHVQYAYDSENRVTGVADAARSLNFASAVTHHPTGGLAGYTSGEGAVHTVSYDARQRPAQMATAGVANLPNLTYGYDPTGNVLTITDARPGASASYTYDAVDRLKTGVGGFGSLAYGYDSLGNRTAKQNGTQTTIYTYASQRLIGTSGAEAATFGYDANGNQTSDPLATYGYTPANMLETATLTAGAVSTYRYDGDQQRALKYQGSTKTTASLRGLGQVLSEFEEEGGQLRWTLDQVYLGSQLLAATRPPAGTTLLTIGKAGAGTGTVTSTPAGIACGPSCSGTAAGFAAGAVVTLSASAASSWVFVGWSGDLDCADGVVTLTDAKTCVATFALTAPLFAKQAPLNGGTSGTRRLTLQWAAAPNASYVVCWDTTNNGVCDTTWQWNATATSRVVELPTTDTYYWQVRTVAAPPTEADEGAWWSVTVTAPPLFTKIAPANGASGLGPALTLQWTVVPNEGYWVCWDTTNNNACDTMWWPSPIPTQVVSNLAAGTYYWQVKTAGAGIAADNGTWHHFSVSAPALYVKQSPGNGATGLGPTVTLQWSAVPDEGYYVCWDMTNNNACDTTWWPTGAGTARVLEGLTTGTYYWQVKTAGGAVLADNGAWHAFTVSTTALFTKTAPTNGQTGLGGSLTLQWTTVPGEGYWVCWDTVNNDACDTMWWPSPVPWQVVNALAAGTYYWQVKTGGGGVPADNGAWHHFTVAAAPGAAASVPRGRDGQSIHRDVLVVVVATGFLALAALTTGRRRRRRVVAAGVVLFVLGPTAAVAQTTTQVVEYYTTDAIGSVRAVTKQVNGQWQVTRHDFMPFGEEVSRQNPPQDKRLFTGKERDSETGSDYFGARYYRGDIARFTTVDPLMTIEENLLDPQRWNRCAYARNNPLKYVDPDGRDAIYVNYPSFPITLPGTHTQLPLGHAAVIAVDEKTGATRYCEYGRYDSDFGKVERRAVPDLVMGKDGKPTAESVERLKQFVSKNLGKGTAAEFTYYDDADSKKVIGFAEQRMQDDKRQPYSWSPLGMNTCKTFAADAVEAGRPQAPWWKRWLGLKRDEEQKDPQ